MVCIKCDNKRAVMVCDTGNTRKGISNSCLQCILAHAGKYDVDLRVCHLPICNVMVDALSRHKFETKHPGRNFRKYLIFVLVEVH